MKTIVWIREDLRIFDNPALHYAAQKGAVLPVYIYPEGLGGASYWWLHHSLEKLIAKFDQQGVQLILQNGKPEKILQSLGEAIGADEVVWNRVYSPIGIDQGKKVKETLSHIKTQSFNAQLLIEPTQILNKQGTPFKVFTPFWKHCQSTLNPSPLLSEPKLKGIDGPIESQTLESWGLLPTKPNWAQGLLKRCQVGEDEAQKNG